MNVVMIICDSWRWDYLGCYGNDWIKTPNLDRLAGEGLSVNPVLTLNNFELVKKYVELGLGVAILDKYALNQADYGKIQVRDLKRFFPERTYGIISRRKGYTSAQSRAFTYAMMSER